ncbi:M3 peptidase, partial [Helicosporidium sp. ATCC 50920]
LDELESETTASWRKVVEPLELLYDSFDRVTSVFELLAAVNQTSEMEAAAGRGMALARGFARRLQLSTALYTLLKRIRWHPTTWLQHTHKQVQALDYWIGKMEKGGVNLPFWHASSKIATFRRLDEEEAELKRKFADNVRQGTAAFHLTLRDGQHLRGVPHSTLAAMAAAARHRNLTYSASSPGAIYPPISDPPLDGAAPTSEWGPWTVTFDPWVYDSMMAYCPTRRIRQLLYQSYESRASQAPWDNVPVMERLLQVRRSRANLLDSASYPDLAGRRRTSSSNNAKEWLDQMLTPVASAAVRLVLRMVRLMVESEARGVDVWGSMHKSNDLQSVSATGKRLFIRRTKDLSLRKVAKFVSYPVYLASFAVPVRRSARPRVNMKILRWAERMLRNTTFSQPDCVSLLASATTSFRPWDAFYWGRLAFSKESLVQHGVAPDEIRNYFTLSRVLSGAFGLFNRLWGIHVVESDDDKPPVWHPDVKHYQLFNGSDLLGSFFFDPFARPNKLSVPFTQTLVKRSEAHSSTSVRTPIVIVSTYIQNPELGEAALLQLKDVQDVFHELGHVIQNLLNRVDEVLIAGTTILSLDFLEMFSQFYELWATDECV